MKVNLKNAAKIFFPSTSLEMLYWEAIANAIDANATEISIKICIERFSKAKELTIEIIDNGDGFDDDNFWKFSNLLEASGEDHKGLGRLVYLQYFNEVKIISNAKDCYREFCFDANFEGKSSKSDVIDKDKQFSKLVFTSYNKTKISRKDYIDPNWLKESTLRHFYPILYSLKDLGKKLIVNFELDITNPIDELISSNAVLDVSKLPSLKSVTIPSQDLLKTIEIQYSIKKFADTTTVITALSVDGRTINVDLFSKDSIPANYEVLMLISSPLFEGKSNASRQSLTLDDEVWKTTKHFIEEKCNDILHNEIPSIKSSNEVSLRIIESKYPHLSGYFDSKHVGLIDKNKAVDAAQRKFFAAQKKLLEATELTDEQYKESLEISSRLLMEYILYRTFIIDKCKTINFKAPENSFHEVIVPMRETFKEDQFSEHLFVNNAWLIDDKFMNYTTILSDKMMKEVVNEVTYGSDKSDDESRPDITVVFSRDPEHEKCDVVIVELKKKDIELAKKEEVISQLKQRARRLMKYYPNQIQRIWFYGVIDFDDEFIRSLREQEYKKIFSFGNAYYKEERVLPFGLDEEFVPIGVSIMDYEALFTDAEKRNETFLQVLKTGIKKARNEIELSGSKT